MRRVIMSALPLCQEGLPVDAANTRTTMSNVSKSHFLKKIVSILLAVCFVLPLSQCTRKTEVQGRVIESVSTLYGFTLAKQGWDGVAAAEFGGLALLLAVGAVFFVPVISLGLKEPWDAAVTLCCAPVAGYFLNCWVFLFSTSPLIGGVVASICWVLLFCTSVITLGELWRRRRKRSM